MKILWLILSILAIAFGAFLFVYGDEIPDPVDIKNCLAKDLSMLTFKSHTPQAHGIVSLRTDGTIGRIVEKSKNPTSNLAVDGVMVLHTDIFNYALSRTKGEYYFSTLVGRFVRDHKVFSVTSKHFIGDITTPADLVRVGQILIDREK